MSRYNYQRRYTTEVRVGDIGIGGSNPIRLQSMTNTSTNDVEGSVAQSKRIADAGGELVRLTTQGVREAENLGLIRKGLEAAGCNVPLVADVHFNPNAAMTAADTAHKVRINPGNFVDAARTFRKLEYTDEEYQGEIERIRKALYPLLDKCKKNHTALRLGVNHGSLSDRIMSRYGDTPEGMTESALEFLRVCREYDFHDVVVSIKASNPVIMTNTVKLLAHRAEEEGFRFPLHIGVTEAGNGEDGRVKSAVGIGALLAEGIGDTIRVSLSEAPENEIPVARLLRDYIVAREGHEPIAEPTEVSDVAERSLANPWSGFEAVKYPLVMGLDIQPSEREWAAVDASDAPENVTSDKPIILSSTHINAPGEMASWLDRFRSLGRRNPVMLHFRYEDDDFDALAVKASADAGFMLLNGYGNGLWIDAPHFDSERISHLALGILQATRLRISRTEYIACPSCGRTLFNLEETLANVKEATSHLTNLKIGVMGCIVNGPGEMADADYGYVGAGPGRVSIYKGKQLFKKNIPTEEALSALISLIKENGDWKEPKK